MNTFTPASPIVRSTLRKLSLLSVTALLSAHILVEPLLAEPGPANSAASTQVDPLDWTFWRGPHFDGVSPETGLIDDFDARGGEGSNVLWKRDDVGTRSTPIVMNGRLYVLTRANPGTPQEGERVVCLDANTGELIWENRFNVWLSDVPDTRVAWSSVVGDPETGNVYALGVCGYMQCLAGETGETIWSLPMHEYFGLLSTYGGRTNYPVIADDLVIVGGVMTGWGELAKPAHRLVAFDKRSGEIVWINGTQIGPYDTNYSAPAVAVIDGQQSLVFGSGDGSLWAFQPRTGLPIWQYEISRRGLNTSPLVIGNTVYMGHSEENEAGTAMGTALAMHPDGSGKLTKSCELWRRYEVMMGKSSPVCVGDRLYVIDDRAKLSILDADTGEDLTQPLTGRASLTVGGTEMRSCPLVADGKLYVVGTTRGDWSIWKLDEEEGLKQLSRGRFPRGEEAPASPICSHGNVYFTTTGGIYCLRDPEKSPGVGPLRSVVQESPVAEDANAAYVQVLPAEVLLQPGDTQSFRARVFNRRGQLLRETDAEFTVVGPGTINRQGQFTASDMAAHQAATVTAHVGDLQGAARVRIVPPLPWSFDFDDLDDPPITWVGARFRHVIRDLDGNKALVKISTIPKGTRSRCWFGPSHLSDYTIQAEVKGSIADNKMPDIGLIAQGYVIDLQGEAQKLQIRTWAPMLRMAKTIDFPWQPDTWYVMKLRAENSDGKALLYGKVWLRDEEEPAEWTLEAVDESPNKTGSPGLFGNATNAELTLDNIRISSNQ